MDPRQGRGRAPMQGRGGRGGRGRGASQPKSLSPMLASLLQSMDQANQERKNVIQA